VLAVVGAAVFGPRVALAGFAAISTFCWANATVERNVTAIIAVIVHLLSVAFIG